VLIIRMNVVKLFANEKQEMNLFMVMRIKIKITRQM